MHIFILALVSLLFLAVVMAPCLILYFVFLNFFGIVEQWPTIAKLTYIILSIITLYTTMRITIKVGKRP